MAMEMLDIANQKHLTDVEQHTLYISGYVDGKDNYEKLMKDVDILSGGFVKRTSCKSTSHKRSLNSIMVIKDVRAPHNI